jgi:hypothetical protein
VYSHTLVAAANKFVKTVRFAVAVFVVPECVRMACVANLESFAMESVLTQEPNVAQTERLIRKRKNVVMVLLFPNIKNVVLLAMAIPHMDERNGNKKVCCKICGV